MGDISPWIILGIQGVVIPLVLVVWGDMRRRVNCLEGKVLRMSDQYVPRRECDLIHASSTEKLSEIATDLRDAVARVGSNGIEGRVRDLEQRLAVLEACE